MYMMKTQAREFVCFSLKYSGGGDIVFEVCAWPITLSAAFFLECCSFVF